MITQTASALLALLLLFGLAACGSKPQDYTSSGDAASMPADGSTGKRVLADGRQPDKDMSARTRRGNGARGTGLAAGIYGGIRTAGSNSRSIPWL